MGEQAFIVEIGQKIDLDRASKKIDYFSEPRTVGMFRAIDAKFNGTILRVFENGWMRLYVHTEPEAYAEALYKATESLVHIRRVVADLKTALKMKVDSDQILASIKPITEALDLHEMLLMDVDSVRPKYKRDMSSTFFRILHHHMLEEVLGPSSAIKILHSTGEEVGKVFAGLYSARDIKSFLGELKKFLDKEKVSNVSVINSSDDKIVLKSEEGMTSSGIPNLGKAMCHFERGFISGAISGFLGRKVTSEETRCWGLGDTYCEFVMHLGGKK